MGIQGGLLIIPEMLKNREYLLLAWGHLVTFRLIVSYTCQTSDEGIKAMITFFYLFFGYLLTSHTNCHIYPSWCSLSAEFGLHVGFIQLY